MDFVDDLQRIVSLPALPQRIVSLVPSLTEALFALGAGERIVGVTDYCTHPPQGVAQVTKVGGTKDPRLEVILQLAPDLVICNDEENRREDFLWLAAHDLPLYVTAPRTVADGIALIDKLGGLLGCQEQSAPLVQAQRGLYDRLASAMADQPRLRVFCPIWRKPWMSFNADTYADDMLWRCGGENILRAQPERYFTVTLEEVAALSPQVIVLPSEPYPFTTKHFVHLKPLADTPAGRSGHFYCSDGMALFWYGPRTIDGLAQFSRLFAYVRSTMD
ncbi:MAG TPA: cobalamin-binding protein [Candidatus Binatia bacterium]|nr:cobalamin-binding protein [Candidatus Binatia bacterium]